MVTNAAETVRHIPLISTDVKLSMRDDQWPVDAGAFVQLHRMTLIGTTKGKLVAVKDNGQATQYDLFKDEHADRIRAMAFSGHTVAIATLRSLALCVGYDYVGADVTLVTPENVPEGPYSAKVPLAVRGDGRYIAVVWGQKRLYVFKADGTTVLEKDLKDLGVRYVDHIMFLGNDRIGLDKNQGLDLIDYPEE